MFCFGLVVFAGFVWLVISVCVWIYAVCLLIVNLLAVVVWFVTLFWFELYVWFVCYDFGFALFCL